MNFNFSEVEVKENSGNSLKFVGYGINNSVEVVKVEGDAPEGKSPFIDIFFKNTGDDDDNSTRIREFLSPGAMPYTMKKVMQLNNAMIKGDALKSKNFSSAQEMAESLSSMWKGKSLRLKLSAEEYEGVDKNGEPKIKTRVSIPMFNFCEAISDGAEYVQISDDNTKLEFDRNNVHDYKPLATSDSKPEQSSKDDLPF